MDRLIEDYEKALTEEFELRQPVERLPEHLSSIKTSVTCKHIFDDPGLAQWKVQEFVRYELDSETRYQGFRKEFIKAKWKHGLAKIHLAVVTERLEFTKARLYGGHYEVLDLQEMGQELDKTVA